MPPSTKFDVSELKLSEIKDEVKKTRSSSAPGPNVIPYKLYKMCPQLNKRLWLLIKVIWWKRKVPEEWQNTEGIFTWRKKDSKDISQIRKISLLNVERKIYFSVLLKHLTSPLLCWYLCLQGWCTWLLRMHWTHMRHKPAAARGKSEQKLFYSSVARSSQRIWLYPLPSFRSSLEYYQKLLRTTFPKST